MNIQIFDNAKMDLVDRFDLYKAQARGVGQYFLDSLYSDIDSLGLYAGIHHKKNQGVSLDVVEAISMCHLPQDG